MSDDSLSMMPPKRRFMDRGASTPTLVAAGTRLDGDLRCAGDLSVSGEIHGDGLIQGMLSLSESGSWYGNLQCARALVAGVVAGHLVVNGKLEVRSSARISGELSVQQLAIAEGAIIEAQINVLSGAAIQRFTEKREA